MLPDVCPRAGTVERVLLAVTAGVRAPLLSLTARAADVSLRLPPSRWLLAGAKPPPGPSPRSPVPADRLLRGATGTGSVSLTPGPPNGPRGAGHRLRRVPPDTFSPCRDSTSDGDVADRSIQYGFRRRRPSELRFRGPSRDRYWRSPARRRLDTRACEVREPRAPAQPEPSG